MRLTTDNNSRRSGGSLRSVAGYLIVVATVCSFVAFMPCSCSNDTLNQTASLTGNQTLVSASNIFEFGFFTPGSSTGRYYLGIWYYNITPQTVVWVGNRENPFSNSSGIISVQNNGRLVVSDPTSSDNILWSSSINGSSSFGDFSAKIQDNGDLSVLILDKADSTVWQSFDFLSDTFLPGMTLTLDTSTNATTTLRSWRSQDDPASGNYSLFLDPRQQFYFQLLTMEKNETKGKEEGQNRSSDGVIWWRSGPWNSSRKAFNGVTASSPQGIFGFSLTPTENSKGATFKFQSIRNQILLRFTLLPNGTITTYIYEPEMKSWVYNWSQPAEWCDLYNRCGSNAVCGREGSNRNCTCLGGFVPRNESDWKGDNWSGGCVRKTTLNCSNTDDIDFEILQKMKSPDHGVLVNPNLLINNESNCRFFCLKNCTCTAYSFLPNDGCFTWNQDLVDLVQFTTNLDVIGGDLNIKLAKSDLLSPPGGNGRWRVVSVAVPVTVGIILLLSLWFCWKYKSKLKDAWKKARTEVSVNDTTTSGERLASSNFSGMPEELHQGEEKPELPLFSFEIIQLATDNFSQSNTLGKGGFGHVYKGVLPGNEQVAVKRLSKNSCQGLEEFKNELLLIAKLQHNNLVRLLGCCIHEDEKILIYEYMPNKSLDDFIFNPTKQPLLNWKKRFSIIEGVARGLLYLHRDSRLRIVHRDLKASNILLDEEMNPKISDFGMARIFGGKQNQDNTNRVVGTFGYMSPEYAMEGLFSVKSDVYSFGVLILEIISGIRNNRFRSNEHPNLLGHAWQAWKEDKGISLVNPSIDDNTCSVEEVLRCLHVGLLCVQDRPNDRPDMSAVIIMLGTESTIQVIPKRPTFAAAESPTRSTTSNYEIYSANELTITTFSGR